MGLLKWNREFALDQAADDVELLQELLDIFKDSFASDLELIREGVAAGDADQVARAAHSIKGAASSLGLAGVSETVKRVEDDGKAGQTTEAARLLPQLEQMLQEVGTLHVSSQ